MALINFDVQNYCIAPSQLLGALEQVIPVSEIDKAIENTSSEETRQRVLPTHVVVALVIAMSFWSRDSIVDVFKNLTHGLSSLLIPEKIRLAAPTSSSISEARQRTGCAVMTRLFETVAKPLASPQTPGAFLCGLRVMAMDGTVFDVPETEANVKVFGYPGSRPGTYPGFPLFKISFCA